MLPDICVCGHPASDHELLDHDAAGEPNAVFRWREGLARWHWICTADTHPDGEADSPWDHVCGCLVNVYESIPGQPSVNPDTPAEVLPLVREALRAVL